MIASNEKRQVRSDSSATIIFMEVAYFAILRWHRHGVEIVRVPDCLSLSGYSSGGSPGDLLT